jgi:hypothetical protein
MHPIQDLFLESFSYVLQFDMHFYMHSYVDKKFYSCKKWVLQRHPLFSLTVVETIDVSYVAPQAHGIVSVSLLREYSPGIVFIFSQGRKDLYHI